MLPNARRCWRHSVEVDRQHMSSRGDLHTRFSRAVMWPEGPCLRPAEYSALARTQPSC